MTLESCTLPLSSSIAFKNLSTVILNQAMSKIKVLATSQRGFHAIAVELDRLEALFKQLRNVAVPARDVQRFNVFHQLSYVLQDLIEIAEQYEDKETQQKIIFKEVYNAQLQRSLRLLRVFSETLAHYRATSTADILQVLDVQQESCHQPPEDFARQVQGQCVLSLPLTLRAADQSLPTVVQAAAAGHWRQVDEVLRLGKASVMATGPIYNLLHLAVLWQDPFAIPMLLGHGAEMDAGTAKDDFLAQDSTALHLACALGNVGVMRLLLCWGASPDLCNSRGQPPAMVCAAPLCRATLLRGPQLLQRARELCSAAYDRQGNKLLSSLQNSVIPLNVKYKPHGSFFLIHQVAFGGQRRVYQVLVQVGACPLLRTKDHALPSEVAKGAGHAELAAMMAAVEHRALAALGSPPPLTLHPTPLQLTLAFVSPYPSRNAPPCLALPPQNKGRRLTPLTAPVETRSPRSGSSAPASLRINHDPVRSASAEPQRPGSSPRPRTLDLSAVSHLSKPSEDVSGWRKDDGEGEGEANPAGQAPPSGHLFLDEPMCPVKTAASTPFTLVALQLVLLPPFFAAPITPFVLVPQVSFSILPFSPEQSPSKHPLDLTTHPRPRP